MTGFRFAGVVGAIFVIGFIDVFAVRLIEFRAIQVAWAVVIMSNLVAFGFGFFARRAFFGKDEK